MLLLANSPAAMSSLDLSIVVAYIVGTTLLGVWFARGQKDVRTYFVGDRDVAWWLVLVSIVATETSTVTFLSVPGIAFAPGGNLAFLQLAIGYVIGRAIIAAVLLPQYFRGEIFSAYQLLRQQYSPAVQRTASALFLLTRTLADGLRLYLTALLLKQFTGWDTTTAILVMGAITLLYTYLGGMQAVIWTDLIQFAVYIAGAVIAGWFILDLMPFGWKSLMQFGQEHSKFTLFDFSWDYQKAYTFWAGLIGGAFITMASHGADQLMVQRYLCARSLPQARFSLISSGIVVFLQFLLFLVIGVGLAALVHHRVLHVAVDVRKDEIFGLFIVNHLPHGIIGLVIAAVLAAAMSTLSSSLNSSANALVTDFYRPLRPDKGDQHYLTVAKIMTACFGVAQIGVAYTANQLNSPSSLIEQVMTVAGFTTGPVLAVFLLGVWRPAAGRSALIGILAGFATVLSIWMMGRRGYAVPAWPWFAPIGTLTTAAVAVVADRFGKTNGPSHHRSA